MNSLLKGRSFCILPWIHIHSSPVGDVIPCCIAKDTRGTFGNTRTQSVDEVVNSPGMKELRLNMLYNTRDPACSQCYAYEDEGIRSARQTYNDEFGKYFNDVIKHTKSDGGIESFKMRYFDIRFTNICNFKCVTCGSDYSSQWEQENKKYRNVVKIIPKNNRKELVEEILEHIPYIELAYFAGGEPLITEEHYIILETFIKKKKSNIRLRYNTNLSNLKFKDKDLLGMWKYFKNGVDVSASIDHYGERAEYIRHGTDWAAVETNLKLCKSLGYIHTSINTVVSAFNFVTINEFYQYLIDKRLYSKKDLTYSLYNMHGPVSMTSQVLPEFLKQQGIKKNADMVTIMQKRGFREEQIKQIINANIWAQSKSTYDIYKDQLKNFIIENDKIRGTDFLKTFPELSELIEK